MDNVRSMIREALNDVAQCQGEGWFVIIEEPISQKFVQFACRLDEGLIFDLPSEDLSAEEFEVAKTLLSAYDIPFQTWDFGAINGVQAGSFGKLIGQDLMQAEDIAYDVFMKVYHLDPKVSLKITIDR